MATETVTRAGELARLAQAALAETAETAEPTPGEKRGPTVVAQLVALALAEHGPDLWHDADGYAWVTYPIAGGDGAPGHHETCRLYERGFRHWLAARLFATARKNPSPPAMQDGLLTLEGVAVNERPRRVVATRLASDPTLEGVIYLDLADDAWRVVRIRADGWRLLTSDEAAELPVRFRRPHGMAPLPIPTHGGSLDALRPFVNVGSNDADASAWRLIIAWLVAALRPTGPYPVLSLTGEQGAAKTTLALLLRALIDPNRAPVRRAPRDERDLMIAATNSWMVALDNLSSLPTWLSDALCVISTGGGFATRAMYENDSETIFSAQRPIILTGIEEAATRGDLVDRALFITLEAIPDKRRMTEKALWQRFAEAQPGILGALLDVVAGALRELPSVQLDGHPRMADFAEWATAAEGTLGWERGAFLRAYQANRRDANDIALDASPVASALLTLLDDTTAAPGGRWDGTSSELLAALAKRASEQVTQSQVWPKTPRGVTGALTRLAPNLRRAGVTILREKAGHSRARLIHLQMQRQPPPSDDEREEGGTQPSAPPQPSAQDANYVRNAELFSDADATEPQTVVRTVGADDREPSADRPQAETASHADSRGFADAADAADGSLHSLEHIASSSAAADREELAIARVALLTMAERLGWPCVALDPPE